MRVSGVVRPYQFAVLAAGATAVYVWYLLIQMDNIRLLAAFLLTVVFSQFFLWTPRVALLLILSWLPLSGFIRRLLDVILPVTFDPLLAVAPIMTGIMVLFAFYSHRSSLARTLRESTVTKLVVLLAVVMVLQIFSPLQGDVLVGMAGAFFFLVPLLWFFLGRAYLDLATIHRLLRLIGLIGLLCGLYGIYQTIFGFLPFEETWIATRTFASLHLGRFIRPFSTFPSPEEWSRYMMIAATAALGFSLRSSRRRGWWLSILAVTTVALLLSGVRISVFGYFLSVCVLLVLAASSSFEAIRRLVFLAAGLAGYLWLVPLPSREEVYASTVASGTFFGHTLRGVVSPFMEDSLSIRFDLWRELFLILIPRHPLGMGLGVPTLGAMRFDTSVQVGTESYAVATFVAAGIIGGLLFMAILLFLSVHALRTCRSRSDAAPWLVAAMLAGILFTSLFGNSLSLYTIGPLGWALMGWLSTQGVPGRENNQDERRP